MKTIVNFLQDFISELFGTSRSMSLSILNVLLEIGVGFTLSGIGKLIIPEVIHLFFVLVFGVVGTITVHLTRRWVHKKFPIK